MSYETERKVCAILPVYDEKSFKAVSRSSTGSLNNLNNLIEFEPSIESTCFDKPLIVFTLMALKRIPCIDTIMLCSTHGRQEQIQNIISDHLPNDEGIKYFSPNMSSKNGSNGNEITINKLLKHCCSYLNETNEIILIHDPNVPYINELIVNDLCFETFKHGAASLSSTENFKNLIVKIEETNIEEDETQTSKNLIKTSGALVSDYLDLNYRVCLKPQAFKYSIFKIIFENCSHQELEEDVDCLKLAKIHADIRAKLIFEKEYISNYPTNLSCIQHYLKEIHKQALIISSHLSQNIYYLQKILRFERWNIEICQNLDREASLKMNEMVTAQPLSGGIVIIKFCQSLDAIKDFEFTPTYEEIEKKSNKKRHTAAK